MVSVTEPTLWQLRNSLAAAAADDPAQPPHARAFTAWVQHQKMGQSAVLKELATGAAALDGPARQTAHAAVLGYATTLDPAFSAAFAAALDWLQQRQYFVSGRPATFEVDGLALLGTAVGLTRLGGAIAARAWLENILRRSLSAQRTPDWNEALIAAALEVIAGNAGGTASNAVSDDLRTALSAKRLMTGTMAARGTTWNLISGLVGSADGMTRAATQLAALIYLLRDTSTLHFGTASVEDVARVLNGVSRSMRRWTWDDGPRTPKSFPAHWEIENEYHVQDMLWAILAPVFPDLDDEEWLKSLGQHHPRADLAIPSLELIVEVKFLRAGGNSVFSGVIEEVAADASTYLQDGGSYQHLIAFVWDDAARTEQHPELRQGLMRIRGVRDGIVLSRPSHMGRQYRQQP